MAAVSKSRCVLAVVSPAFIANEFCRFCFEITVRDAQVDVIYVLYGGITSPNDDRLHSALCEDVCVALRSSRRCFVSPLSEADFRNGDMETLRRNPFWVKVRWAIPNRQLRRKEQERQPLLASASA